MKKVIKKIVKWVKGSIDKIRNKISKIRLWIIAKCLKLIHSEVSVWISKHWKKSIWIVKGPWIAIQTISIAIGKGIQWFQDNHKEFDMKRIQELMWLAGIGIWVGAMFLCTGPAIVIAVIITFWKLILVSNKEGV